jgi:hypothetical protein
VSVGVARLIVSFLLALAFGFAVTETFELLGWM